MKMRGCLKTADMKQQDFYLKHKKSLILERKNRTKRDGDEGKCVSHFVH